MRNFLFALLFAASPSSASHSQDAEPWKRSDAIIVPDPYAANDFDFDKAFADPKVRAIILKGAEGLTVDPKLRERAKEARRRNIPFGIYLLALGDKPHRTSRGTRPGVDPMQQADMLVRLGRETGAQLLALDLEGLTPNFMSLEDASRVVARVQKQTGRAPAVYTNGGVAAEVAKRYDGSSSFAKTPLWIAGTREFKGNRVWPTYALWQFGAEWDCPKEIRLRRDRYNACRPYRRYPVDGSQFDLDVNYLRGGDAELAALFGPAVKPR